MVDQKAANLWAKFEAAGKKLGPSGAVGESEYMIAYQQLVRAGLAMQLKKKYRGSK